MAKNMNVEILNGIRRIVDDVDPSDLQDGYVNLKNKLASANMRRGTHNNPQLAGLRQELARQARIYAAIAEKYKTAVTASCDMTGQ
jgi:hypothetical protein